MKDLIKNLLKEGLNKKRYIGQCDILRRKSEENERFWQEMMKNRKKIPFNTFLSNVDMSPMLDDGENPKTFIQDAVRTDSETSTYVSNWGPTEAMFLQTAGFEFIFI